MSTNNEFLQELLPDLKANDPEAWRLLYDTLHSRLIHFAVSKCGMNEDDAKDIVQTAFMNANRRIRNNEEMKKLKGTYFYQIVRRLCIKKGKNKNNKPLSNQGVGPADPQKLPFEVLLQKESEGTIAKAIECLSKEHRKVITLTYFSHKQMTREAIAEQLGGIDVKTVFNRLKRAEDILRELLRQLILNQD